MKVTAAIKAARKNLGASGAAGAGTKGSQIDHALFGGKAPSLVSHVSKHIGTVPTLFGRKNVAEVFGVGDIYATSAQARLTAIPSINLGCQKSFKHIDPELKSLMLDLKKQIHNAFLMQRIFAAKNPGIACQVHETEYFKARVEPLLKAYDLTDFAAWVPTVNANFYFQELELEPMIEKYFDVYPMASKTVTVPGTDGRLKAKLEGDAATFAAQYQTEKEYTLDAKNAVAHTDITEDLLQDMVPSEGSFEILRREVAMGCARSKEDAILNGDDSATHMDSDTHALPATEFNKAFKGLRKRAIAAGNTYDHAGAAVDLDAFKGTAKVLGKNTNNKRDLLFILGDTIGNNVVMGDVPEILTYEQWGPNATIHTGDLPKVFGVEPYQSEWHREDVSDAGVYDGVTTNRTTLLCVKKSRFKIGARAPIKIWATPSLASSDKMLLSAKERFTFGGPAQSSTEKSVSAGIDILAT